jgi:hypothetical protein
MRLTISYIVLIIGTVYWLSTLCFNVPDNYVSLSLIKQSKEFNSFFYQNWSFFAPPPKANDKAYFIFYSKKDTSNVSFEILQSLNRAKQKKVPFHWNEDILDYIISNAVIGISNELVDISDTKKYLTESIVTDSGAITQVEINEQIQKSYSFTTLINYSRVIAKANSINLDNYYFQLKLTRQSIPRFSERFNINNKPIEEMYFKSERLNAGYEKTK